MAKAKTSAKPKPFSVKGLQVRQLKRPAAAKSHDPDAKLRDPAFISKALMECLWEGDIETFKEIVRAHYEAVNTAAVLRKIGLSKRTFYEAISAKGNPRLETVTKMIKGLRNAA